MKLTSERIGALCAALSHLAHAGIGTGDALLLLAQEETDPELRRYLTQMAQQADEGTALWEVFAQAGCFPGYVCTLLEVAYHAGKTEQTLSALSDYYVRRAQMTARIKAALTYPAALLGVVLLVMIVLPVFDQVYAQLGSRLTGFAGGLLVFGSILRKCLPFICAALFLGLVAAVIVPLRERLIQFTKNRWGAHGVFAQIYSARFIQALSLALSSGITPQEAGVLACGLAKDAPPAFCTICKQFLQALDTGTSLPHSLKQAGLLIAAHSTLLEVGIRSGHMESVLSQLSQQLLVTSEEALERKIGRIEPVMVAICCVLIGSVLLSVMLPLIHIMNAIG